MSLIMSVRTVLQCVQLWTMINTNPNRPKSWVRTSIVCRTAVQVVLEIKSEQQLANLSQKLQQEGIQHKLWVEQPENYPTCLATKPYRKSQAAAHFKKLQLCKAVLTKA